MKNSTIPQKSHVDEFYNLIQKHSDYGNNSELVGLILEAKENGKITDSEVTLLLKILLRKEATEQVRELHKWSNVHPEKKDRYQMLINISSKERKYA